MEKVLQELFWVPIPFKLYQNTPGCSTVSSAFSCIMPMGSKPLPLAATENTSLTLEKRKYLLESKLQASFEQTIVIVCSF